MQPPVAGHFEFMRFACVGCIAEPLQKTLF
jgi:hypothetical protein